MMKPNALLVVVSVIFGIIAGRWSVSSKDSKDTTNPSEIELADQLKDAEEKRMLAVQGQTVAEDKIRRLESELSRLSDVDLAEYLRLQNDEQKFKKANELLGKVFMILFNYVLTAKPDQLAFAQQASEDIKNVDEKESAPGLNDEPNVTNTETSSAKTGQPPEVDSSWIAPEKALPRLKNDGSKKFLDAVVIPDIRAEIKNARPFSANDQKIANLQGTFAGSVTFLEKKKDLENNAYQMELDFQGQIDELKPKGNLTVRLFKNGNKFSDSRGSGELKDVYNTASDSKAILIKTGDNHMFQLYYIEQHDMIIGNYYEQTSPGEFVHTGRVNLQKN